MNYFYPNLYQRFYFVQHISFYYRDCRTYENLAKHICVAPPHQPFKRVKRILDFINGSNEISDLLKELEGATKKGGAIKAGRIYPKWDVAKVSRKKIQAQIRQIIILCESLISRLGTFNPFWDIDQYWRGPTGWIHESYNSVSDWETTNVYWGKSL